MESTKYKKYVSVEAKTEIDGNVLPIAILWEDGQRFEIDKITDIRYAASQKAGGAGTRYTCIICGQMRYLYFEDPRWFVEIGKNIG